MPELPRVALFRHADLGPVAVTETPSPHADGLFELAGLVPHPRLPIHVPPPTDNTVAANRRLQHAARLLKDSGFPVSLGPLSTVKGSAHPLSDLVERHYLEPSSHLGRVYDTLKTLAAWSVRERVGEDTTSRLATSAAKLVEGIEPLLDLVDDLNRLDPPLIVPRDELPAYVFERSQSIPAAGPLSRTRAADITASLYGTSRSPLFRVHLGLHALAEWSGNDPRAERLSTKQRLRTTAVRIVDAARPLTSVAAALRRAAPTTRPQLPTQRRPLQP